MVARCPHMERCQKETGVRSLTDVPANVMVNSSAEYSPMMSFASVVLPTPLGALTYTISPGRIMSGVACVCASSA